MKKILLILTAIIILCPKSLAAESTNIALLEKKGFFEHAKQVNQTTNPCEDVRRVLYTHLRYANNYDLKGLESLYSPNYKNSDGFDKNIYFDLVKKTWDSYPDIKYKMEIKNIDANENVAVAQVVEKAVATTKAESGLTKEKGLLESTSDSVYYFEKINNEWLLTSDHILYEKTFLGYGTAKETLIDINAPAQIGANTEYTASLKLTPPKDSLVIASIGQEKITYPQNIAEEVFRKLPDDGILERIFKSNSDNVNEYAVSSFGITKAEMAPSREIKVYITGLGFVMSRVNVIPVNNLIKPVQDDNTKNTKDAKDTKSTK